MSDAAQAPAPCPISADFLPPNMRKHVDPQAPVPLRMMAAKSLVPLSPSDMLSALFMLTFDPDATVRDTAVRTAAGLPDRILSAALRDEGVQAPVLGHFLRLLGDKDVYAEMLVLNANTPDDAVAQVARACSARLAETIGQNQLRFLRHDDIRRKLCGANLGDRSQGESLLTQQDLCSALGLSHSIAGAVEAFYRVFAGDAGWMAMVGDFVVPAVIGNLIGGVLLVALLNHGQVATRAVMPGD